VPAWTHLLIEPLTLVHAEGLYEALDDQAVHRYLPAPEVTTLDALRARIERLAYAAPLGERWWNFAVRLADTRTIVGRLEATTYGDAPLEQARDPTPRAERPSDRDPWGEIAYVFGPPWWGRGLATEATRWLVDQLAAHGVDELWAAVHPANLASQRLLARLGFARAVAPSRPLGSFDPGDLVFVKKNRPGRELVRRLRDRRVPPPRRSRRPLGHAQRAVGRRRRRLPALLRARDRQSRRRARRTAGIVGLRQIRPRAKARVRRHAAQFVTDLRASLGDGASMRYQR
jgi:RimJ/RimL family protein N-acetyltransferase